MPTESVKIVLDTNIVISAAISRDGNPACIFELFLEGKIINYTTEEIIKELEEVMKRPFFKDMIDEDYRKFILDNFKNLSIVVQLVFDDKAVLKDEKDNKFINCALSAEVGVIVSGDKHLLELRNYKGIDVLNARLFLLRFWAEPPKTQGF